MKKLLILSVLAFFGIAAQAQHRHHHHGPAPVGPPLIMYVQPAPVYMGPPPMFSQPPVAVMPQSCIRMEPTGRRFCDPRGCWPEMVPVDRCSRYPY